MKKLIVLALALALFPTHAFAKPEKSGTSPEESCQSEILLEPYSGLVLFERNADQARPPASMIKMMVAYLAMNRVREGSASLSDLITTSALASKIGGSQVYLKQGEQFTLEELLKALMIQSANDAATAIAEYLGGSVEGFVEMMNQEAAALGMSSTVFHSPHGLPPAKGDSADLSTARDLATLGRAIIERHPTIIEWAGKGEEPFRDGTFSMRNHNHLVRQYPGCDGIKTGYYREAGFGVTATAMRNGVRMLAVVMGCEQRKAREAQAAALLSKGFAQYKMTKLVDKGTPIQLAVKVIGGKVAEIVPVAAETFSGVVKVGEFSRVAQRLEPCSEIKAPASAGTECGVMRFMSGDKEIGKVKLVIPQEIPAGGIISKIRAWTGY